MRVPLLDLTTQHAAMRSEVLEAAHAVIDGQAFVLGEPVARFEATLARMCGVAHAVGVASGTDALVLALVASGVGEGDRVVTTPFTFVATAEAIARVGAEPVFVDVEPDTMNLSPSSVEAAIAAVPRVRAVVAVHLFGHPAEMDALGTVARAHRLRVVEDAAQAMGATYGGKRVGGLGDAAALSFFPAKNLGAWGDAGALTTNDEAVAARVRRLRQHGTAARGSDLFVELGMNSRLDALQAAVLDVKARHLEAWNDARRAAGARYRALLAPLDASEALRLPSERLGARHVYHQYVVRTERRDALRAHLAEAGVETRAYYTRPLHRQPCFAGRSIALGGLDEVERSARTALALPMYPELTEAQQAYVADAIAAFFR